MLGSSSDLLPPVVFPISPCFGSLHSTLAPTHTALKCQDSGVGRRPSCVYTALCVHCLVCRPPNLPLCNRTQSKDR